jgi:hypothetical protein
MRAIKAKRLRKEIYGDKSTKGVRKYAMVGKTVVNTGLRAMYRLRKRIAKGGTYSGLLYESCGQMMKQAGQAIADARKGVAA